MVNYIHINANTGNY